MPASDPSAEVPPIDAKIFWRLMGAGPVAVPVVAARDTEGPAGLLALSATHVSATPPTMLVAVGRWTGALKTIKASGAFSIGYLPQGAEETADFFGGRRGLFGADRFADSQWSTLSTGAPGVQRRRRRVRLPRRPDFRERRHGSDRRPHRCLSQGAERRPLLSSRST